MPMSREEVENILNKNRSPRRQRSYWKYSNTRQKYSSSRYADTFQSPDIVPLVVPEKSKHRRGANSTHHHGTKYSPRSNWVNSSESRPFSAAHSNTYFKGSRPQTNGISSPKKTQNLFNTNPYLYDCNMEYDNLYANNYKDHRNFARDGGSRASLAFSEFPSYLNSSSPKNISPKASRTIISTQEGALSNGNRSLRSGPFSETPNSRKRTASFMRNSYRPPKYGYQPDQTIHSNIGIDFFGHIYHKRPQQPYRLPSFQVGYLNYYDSSVAKTVEDPGSKNYYQEELLVNKVPFQETEDAIIFKKSGSEGKKISTQDVDAESGIEKTTGNVKLGPSANLTYTLGNDSRSILRDNEEKYKCRFKPHNFIGNRMEQSGEAYNTHLPKFPIIEFGTTFDSYIDQDERCQWDDNVNKSAAAAFIMHQTNASSGNHQRQTVYYKYNEDTGFANATYLAPLEDSDVLKNSVIIHLKGQVSVEVSRFGHVSIVNTGSNLYSGPGGFKTEIRHPAIHMNQESIQVWGSVLSGRRFRFGKEGVIFSADLNSGDHCDPNLYKSQDSGHNISDVGSFSYLLGDSYLKIVTADLLAPSKPTSSTNVSVRCNDQNQTNQTSAKASKTSISSSKASRNNDKFDLEHLSIQKINDHDKEIFRAHRLNCNEDVKSFNMSRAVEVKLTSPNVRKQIKQRSKSVFCNYAAKRLKVCLNFPSLSMKCTSLPNLITEIPTDSIRLKLNESKLNNSMATILKRYKSSKHYKEGRLSCDKKQKRPFHKYLQQGSQVQNFNCHSGSPKIATDTSLTISNKSSINFEYESRLRMEVGDGDVGSPNINLEKYLRTISPLLISDCGDDKIDNITRNFYNLGIDSKIMLKKELFKESDYKKMEKFSQSTPIKPKVVVEHDVNLVNFHKDNLDLVEKNNFWDESCQKKKDDIYSNTLIHERNVSSNSDDSSNDSYLNMSIQLNNIDFGTINVGGGSVISIKDLKLNSNPDLGKFKELKDRLFGSISNGYFNQPYESSQCLTSKFGFFQQNDRCNNNPHAEQGVTIGININNDINTIDDKNYKGTKYRNDHTIGTKLLNVKSYSNDSLTSATDRYICEDCYKKSMTAGGTDYMKSLKMEQSASDSLPPSPMSTMMELCTQSVLPTSLEDPNFFTPASIHHWTRARESNDGRYDATYLTVKVGNYFMLEQNLTTHEIIICERKRHITVNPRKGGYSIRTPFVEMMCDSYGKVVIKRGERYLYASPMGFVVQTLNYSAGFDHKGMFFIEKIMEEGENEEMEKSSQHEISTYQTPNTSSTEIKIPEDSSEFLTEPLPSQFLKSAEKNFKYTQSAVKRGDKVNLSNRGNHNEIRNYKPKISQNAEEVVNKKENEKKRSHLRDTLTYFNKFREFRNFQNFNIKSIRDEHVDYMRNTRGEHFAKNRKFRKFAQEPVKIKSITTNDYFKSRESIGSGSKFEINQHKTKVHQKNDKINAKINKFNSQVSLSVPKALTRFSESSIGLLPKTYPEEKIKRMFKIKSSSDLSRTPQKTVPKRSTMESFNSYKKKLFKDDIFKPNNNKVKADQQSDASNCIPPSASSMQRIEFGELIKSSIDANENCSSLSDEIFEDAQ